MFDYKRRWEISIHESAHLVIGLLLAANSDEKAAAILLSQDGGVAPLPTSLSEFNLAVAVAAGPQAEELLRFAPVPDRQPDAPADVSDLRTFPKTPTGQESKATESKSDSVRIAEYCIAGCSSRPWKWLQNYDSVVGDSRWKVLEHESLILAVAERVFRNGCWLGSRDDLNSIENNRPATDSPVAV
jgi:hypothetical protein